MVAAELAAGLARRGHDAHLFSYALPFRFREGSPAGVSHHHPPATTYPLFAEHVPHGIALVQSLACAAEEVCPHVLHAHYAFPFALVHELAASILGHRERRPRSVVTLHGSDTTLLATDPCYRDITRDALEMADAVTAVSAALAAETREAFGMERDITVVPNFVDADRFTPDRDPHPAVSAALEAGEAPVLHVSNYRAVKRPDLVVGAFAAIAAERPARLLLVGDGPELPAAVSLAEELGVGGRVERLGETVGIETLYPGAALLLNASDHESFGLAILEALSCGVPVAATEVGGVREVTGPDGPHSRLVPPGDALALAAAGLSLLEDGDSGAARERALAFPPSASVEAYLDVYRG